MSTDEKTDLIELLVRELIDVAALNQYYGSLIRGPQRRWAELSDDERAAYRERAFTQAQAIFAAAGWGMDVQDMHAIGRVG
jgi:hypothetical protein